MCNGVFILNSKHFSIARALSAKRREVGEVSMNQIIKGLIYYAGEFLSAKQEAKIMYEEREMITGMGLKESGKG